MSDNAIYSQEKNYSSLHHSFDIHLAAEYGIEEAIIIHHFEHWIGVNARLDRNFHEGRYWTYQTLDDIAAHFPYWSKDQIVTIIERLCNGKSRFEKTKKFEPVLIKGNFNKAKYDRTVWYAFVDEKKFSKLCNHKKAIVEPQDRNGGTTTPIPDTKPYTKTDNKKNTLCRTSDKPLRSSPSSKSTKKIFSPSVYKIRDALYESIISWKGNLSKSQKRDSWLDDIDKLIRLDGIKESQILAVIEWLGGDSNDAVFWRTNILSGKKLRMKFDYLEAKMVSNKRKKEEIFTNEALKAFGF